MGYLAGLGSLHVHSRSARLSPSRPVGPLADVELARELIEIAD
jgi:hypothetical protein